MQDLIKHEQFELEVLGKLNSARLLKELVFCGGTMLRLCHGLNRFSVDLDFWLIKEIDTKKLFLRLSDCLGEKYKVKDSCNKFNTLLFELSSKDYSRSLKIEIRKEVRKVKVEQSIAYGKNSTLQVILKSVTLQEMMRAKFAALIDRREIRDAYDLEFLVKRGISIELGVKERAGAIEIIDNFKKVDYSSKLGALLEPAERKYYIAKNFTILKEALKSL